MKKVLFTLAMMLLPMLASAADDAVEIDGIYYNLVSVGVGAEVTSGPIKYTGDITIPETVKYMGDTYTVKTIGVSAFYSCSGLTSITIPNSVTKIRDCAFDGCTGLTSVTIPNSVTTISSLAFEGCTGLTSVTIGNNVKSIGPSAFFCCYGLTTITIPNSVTSIGEDAFSSCSGLTTVIIGSGIKNIYSSAFQSCSGLEDMYCYAEKVPTTGDNVFYNSNISNATLHVPDASVNDYSQAFPWMKFKVILGLSGKKCATPTISLVGGKLHFECETEGVTYKTTYQLDNSDKIIEGETIVLGGITTCQVSVYATKEGYEDSDVATANVEIGWGTKGDADGDGVVDIADAVHIVNFIVGKINSLAPRLDSNQTNPE